jgi:hypothetical protein
VHDGSARGGKWLADQPHRLQQAGIDVAVSVVTDHKVAKPGLGAATDTAAAGGIQPHRPPTPDRHAPDRVATASLATTESTQNV